MSAAPHWESTVGDVGQPFHAMVGRHPLMLELFDAIERAATARAPVLVEGVTGVGKDLIAQALHKLSAVSGPLVALNVATLSDTLVESELFGAVRGAYTGSTADRDGVVAAAAGGTLFLDEAGDLSPAVQAKLLRTLEAGEYRPVGACRERRSSFRLILTVQESPQALLASKRWRPDFYYRIAGIVLRVPPLRARASDVPLLAVHLLQSMGVRAPTAGVLMGLSDYSWPGNVRQLKRAIERALFRGSPSEITAGTILEAAHEMDPEWSAPSGGDRIPQPTLRVQERERILEALAANRSTREAADCLGLSVDQLYRRLRRHAIPAPRAQA